MDRLAKFIIKFKKQIIIFSMIWTILFSLFLIFTDVDPDIQNMLPHDLKSRVDLRDLEKEFGGKEIAVVLIESDKNLLNKDTLKKIKNYSEKLKKLEGVDSVYSLADIPKLNIKNIKQIKKNKLVYGSLISKDLKILSIIINLSSSIKDENQLTKNIKKINICTDKPQCLPPKTNIYFGGMPFLRSQISKDIPNDMGMFIGLGMIIMLIFLKLSLKETRGVILPIMVVGIAIITAMGSIFLLDWKFQIVTLILPVILIAVANDYGIHFISKYQELNAESSYSNEEIVSKTIKSLGAPILATGITTIFGLLSLLSHIIIPAKQMAILGAIGVFSAIMMSILLIPSIILYLPKPKALESIKVNTKKEGFLIILLRKTSFTVIKIPKSIIFSFVLVAVFMAIGIFKIDVDTNPVNYYPKESELNKISEIVNIHFGGSQIINIVASGDIASIKNLKKIKKIQNNIAKNKYVGKVTSIVDLLEGISLSLSPNSKPDVLKNKNSIKYLLKMYMMLAKDTSNFISKDEKKSLISVYVNDEGNEAVKSVLKTIKKEIKNDKLFTKTSGAAIIFSELIDEVVKGQLISLIISILIVFILIVILFRSFVIGLISIIPISIAIIILFGVMGFAKIKLDISTTMLSSIMIGVGIDYTIHFLWKFRDLVNTGKSYESSILKTSLTVGRGILFNGLSVTIGFSVLLFSVFMPVKFFGFLIILSIMISLIASFTLLPAILLLVKPKAFK